MHRTVQLDNLTAALYGSDQHLCFVASAVNVQITAAAEPPKASPVACSLEGLQVSEMEIAEGPRLSFDLPVRSVDDFFLVLHGSTGRRQADAEVLTQKELMRLHSAGLTSSRGMRIVLYASERKDGLVEVLDFSKVALCVVGVRISSSPMHGSKVQSLRLKAETQSDPLQPWDELVGHAGVRRLVMPEEMAAHIIPAIV